MTVEVTFYHCGRVQSADVEDDGSFQCSVCRKYVKDSEDTESGCVFLFGCIVLVLVLIFLFHL